MRSNGEDSGFWCGFGRRFIMIPSGLTLGIGLLMAGVAGPKQAFQALGAAPWWCKWAPGNIHPAARELGAVALGIPALEAVLLIRRVVPIFAAIGGPQAIV